MYVFSESEAKRRKIGPKEEKVTRETRHSHHKIHNLYFLPKIKLLKIEDVIGGTCSTHR